MKLFIQLALRLVPRKYLQLVGGWLLRQISFFYRGNTVECPITGKSYRRFLPYGRLHIRPNALCPDSLSLERHRLLWLFLLRKTNFFQAPLKVLHIAPELCFLEKFEKLPNLQEYITADLNSPWAKVKMDIHQMPFADNHFDVVLCNHVLEHVSNDIQALREIYRVLKPKGWAILQSPVDWNLEKTYEDPSITSRKARERAFGQSDHLRLYGKDYPDRIASVGFRVTVDNFVQTLSEYETKRYALDVNELIVIATKP